MDLMEPVEPIEALFMEAYHTITEYENLYQGVGPCEKMRERGMISNIL
jgi:hypothetical protein